MSVYFSSHLQRECRYAVAISDAFCGYKYFQIEIRHCAAAFFLQVPKQSAQT